MTRRDAGRTATKRSSAYADGREKALHEKAESDVKRAAQKEKGNMPFRLWLRPEEERAIVVLDEAPTFFRHEHSYKNPQTGNWDGISGCVKETDSCPACKSLGKESYYAMYLSVIDLTTYKDKEGKEIHASRKLLVVKPQQQAKWFRKIDKALDEEGTLRGAVFILVRSDENAANIGDDIEADGFEPLENNPDFERTWKDREGKSHSEDLTEIYDYDKLFPEDSVEDLETQFNVAPAPGSSRYADADDEDDRSARRRGGSRSKPKDDEEEEEDTPSRSNRSSKRSSSRSAPKREEEDNHEEDEGNKFASEDDSQEEYGEEKPRGRSSKRGASKAEPEEKTRGRSSRTSRRSSTR
jgi:hypothetical protein